MTISTSQIYDRSASLFSALAKKTDTLQTQIGTGKRIVAPSDDAVSYRRLVGIKQAAADDAAYAGNIGLSQSLLAQSDTTLSSIESRIQYAQELTLQASNGTLSPADQKVIATQLKAVLDDLVGLANSRDSRGQPLFAAATGATGVTRAADGTVSFAGTGTPALIPIGENNSVQPTESAERVFGNIATASGNSDVFAIITKFAAALDVGLATNPTAAAEANGALKTALDQVTGVRSSVGVRGARLDLESERLTETQSNREADRSALEDTDVTAAITELQKTLTVLQATQTSFSRLSQLSLFDVLR